MEILSRAEIETLRDEIRDFESYLADPETSEFYRDYYSRLIAENRRKIEESEDEECNRSRGFVASVCQAIREDRS